MPWLNRIQHEIPRRRGGGRRDRVGIVAQAIGKYHTQLTGAFTVIQHATIRIRGM